MTLHITINTENKKSFGKTEYEIIEETARILNMRVIKTMKNIGITKDIVKLIDSEGCRVGSFGWVKE